MNALVSRSRQKDGTSVAFFQLPYGWRIKTSGVMGRRSRLQQKNANSAHLNSMKPIPLKQGVFFVMILSAVGSVGQLWW